MTDAEIRIECIKAAASTPGNPNTMDLARAYYGFVTEGLLATQVVAAAVAKSTVKKGGAK